MSSHGNKKKQNDNAGRLSGPSLVNFLIKPHQSFESRQTVPGRVRGDGVSVFLTGETSHSRSSLSNWLHSSNAALTLAVSGGFGSTFPRLSRQEFAVGEPRLFELRPTKRPCEICLGSVVFD